MAGIYNRILRTAPPTFRLPADLLHVSMHLRSQDIYDDTALFAALNTNIFPSLSGAEVTDVNNIVTEMLAVGNPFQRISYSQTVRAVAVLAEEITISETDFRSFLGIP